MVFAELTRHDCMTESKTRSIVLVLKIVLPIGLIAWLLYRIPNSQWIDLHERSKDWPLLAASLLLGTSAVCLTFWRWQLLVQALHIPFRTRDAFRLGFLGYLFNFVSA